uniref:Uncharacterized protein n=1 Tax=Vitis vinifera TaxID=29760 RepID=A5B1W7_VITVI|nr:hypothetical protein VITISV_006374 [Vitis vinifera]
MTEAAVFLRTFGALPEVHFLHAIYHFKAQEGKNPTLQTVYDLELKGGRYGLWKTTAPSMCEFRTIVQACANFAQQPKLVRNSHNTFPLCAIRTTPFPYAKFASA